MKTTKWQRDIWREWALDDSLHYECIMDIMDDADEAEHLEKEVTELRQWLKHHEKAEPEAWHKLRAENAELRAKLQQYKEALAMCTKQLGDIQADLIQK